MKGLAIQILSRASKGKDGEPESSEEVSADDEASDHAISSDSSPEKALAEDFIQAVQGNDPEALLEAFRALFAACGTDY